MAGHPFELEGTDQPLGPLDLAIRAVEGRLGAVRPARDVPPDASRSDVHLVNGGRISPRPPPERDQLRVRVHVEYPRARRVERAFHDNLPVRRQRELVGLLVVRFPGFPLGRFLQTLRELVERLAPADLGSLAVLAGGKAVVLQCHLRLAVLVLERHRHQHFERNFGAHPVVRRGDHVAFLISKGVRVDDPLRRDDLAVDARAPVVLSLRRSHAIEKDAAHAEVGLEDRRREASRPPPAPHLLRVRPGFPNTFLRRVEDARNDDASLRGGPFSFRRGLRRHGHSSKAFIGGRTFLAGFVVCVIGFPPSVWPIGRSGPPTGRGSASATRTPR